MTTTQELIARLRERAEYEDNGGVVELQLFDMGALLRKAADALEQVEAALAAANAARIRANNEWRSDIGALVEQLRALARGEHDDLSIGDDAADALERLTSANADLEHANIEMFNQLAAANAARIRANNEWRLDYNKLAIERNRLAAELAAAEARLATGGKVELETTAGLRETLAAIAKRHDENEGSFSNIRPRELLALFRDFDRLSSALAAANAAREAAEERLTNELSWHDETRDRLAVLETALREVRSWIDEKSWANNFNCDRAFQIIDAALNPKTET